VEKAYRSILEFFMIEVIAKTAAYLLNI